MAKVFKSGSVYESSYFQNEMDVIAAAMNIVNRFNQSRVIDRHIYLNQPAVWQYAGGQREGQKVLVEPFIENFQKFNSNTGWQDRDGTPWNLVMQALSHFSYHSTGGGTVLCDLQVFLFPSNSPLPSFLPVPSLSFFSPYPLDLVVTSIREESTATEQCSQTQW